MTVARVSLPGAARAALRRFPRRAEVWPALALIAAGTLIRLGLILSGWPKTDSDEGTMGLMALHVAYRGEHPLFFYGQSYMGTIQAYIGAALFHLFGPSLVTLRLGLLLLFILFLLVMYPLLRLLYGQTFALIGLALLDLGGPDLLQPQLLALGGYPETLLFGALSLLLAVWLALGADARAGERPGWRRLALYAALGLTMGLGWWSDQLVFPLLAPAALLPLIFRRRELAWRGLIALAGGALVGVLPQIIFLITRPGETGPSAIAAFEWQGMTTLTHFPGKLGAQIAGALVVALPNITGLGWVCAAPTNRIGALAGVSSAGALACVSLRLAWSLGLLALGVVAALSGWRSLRAYPRPWRPEEWPRVEYIAAVKRCARLMLLLGGGLTLVFYTLSPAAATPAGNARYLIGMTIALPAIVYPLWAPHATHVFRARAWRRTLWPRRALLALLGVTLIGGVVSAYHASAATRARYQGDLAFIHALERLGVRHMHTDYWTCDKLAFLSQERITCDVLSATLKEQRFNRYPPYVLAVQADPRAAYVFPADLPQAAAIARVAAAAPGRYTLTRLDGYVIYVPNP